jgi:hypothetical protein
MDNSFQTSFIPKKPITAPVATHTRFSASLFVVFALIVLSITSVLAIGLYFYKSYLTNQKIALSSSLVKVKDNFDKNTIEELQLFDKRSTTAKQVLTNHVVLSPLFSLLGEMTIPAIQYTRFSHDTVDKVFSVKISGVARDYKSVAQQADAFNGAQGKYLKGVVFSNLTKDKSGAVTFDLEFTVDPALLSYEKNVALDQVNNPTTDTPKAQVPVSSGGRSGAILAPQGIIKPGATIPIQ